MPWTEKQLEAQFPFIKWREPLVVKSAVSGDEGLACRFCIAQKGLRESDIKSLCKTREEFSEHMRREHEDAHI